MFEVIIIGAGLSGVLAALELAKKYKVLIIEAGPELLPNNSSSYNECYKLHTGVHYIGDHQTAHQCLLHAIEFAQKFPEYITDKENLASPSRRGRHYIMKNSFVSTQSAKEIALFLQETYANLIRKDPANQVFGSPEDFIKILQKEDFPYIADTISYYNAEGKEQVDEVVMGIETAESQIDIHPLKYHLNKLIYENPHITFLPSTRVTHIAYRPDAIGYTVTSVNVEGNEQTHYTKSVVNCAWQNIETLDRKLGVYVPDEHRVIRIKASILIKLPESLKNINTCIFSSGPYCSITRLSAGKAVLTSERITNIGYYNAGQESPPENIQKLLREELKLNHPKGKEIAQQILKDCAAYLRQGERVLLQNASIEALHVGYVKLMNINNQYSQDALYTPVSVIHSRQNDGVEHKELGYIANSGMKMTYTAGNAHKISSIIDEDFRLMALLKELIPLVKKQLPENLLHKYQKIVDPILHFTFRDRMIELSRELKDTDKKEKTRVAALLTTEVVEALNKRDLLSKSFKNTPLGLKNSTKISSNPITTSIKPF